MNIPKFCLHCMLTIDNDNYLQCIECKKYVHVKCLKRPGTPGDLLGDVFFQFSCSHCTDDGKEIFIRIRLPWAMLVVLALHNMSIQSKGLSHHGFFHWRTHIASFIEKHWICLMGPSVKRKRKWCGTVSGTLSHNTPVMFTSGFDIFKESGWWKLTYNQSPKLYMELYQKLRSEKKKPAAAVEQFNYSADSSRSSFHELDAKRLRPNEVSNEEERIFSRSLPYMGRQRWYRKADRKPTTTTSVASSSSSNSNIKSNELNEFLTSNMSNTDLLTELPNISPRNTYAMPLFTSSSRSNDWPESVEEADERCYQPRIVQVTNFQEADEDDEDVMGSDYSLDKVKKEVQSDGEDGGGEEGDSEELDYNERFRCEKSLFKSNSVRRRLPWLDEDGGDEEGDDFVDDNNENIELMCEYDENEILQKLKTIISGADACNKSSEIPAWIRRFYRKLCVRQIKRSTFRPIFDIDNLRSSMLLKSNEQILDRYHQLLAASDTKSIQSSFHSTLAGCVQYDLFESPHTGRVLHPFIYRNAKDMPLWIKLMCELQYSVNGVMPSRGTIDYCYVRPHHIAAVNALLQRQFWPGIDMSECLSYPDFSIVALYKKLVIGCGFLVPDVGHNDAYVSFMAVRPGWQRAGIATFMLYHLTQTCMSHDITLHVSATNTAICLYQKFGFKIEEVILDFYEKYLPNDSTQSRHAFLLRMKR